MAICKCTRRRGLHPPPRHGSLETDKEGAVACAVVVVLPSTPSRLSKGGPSSGRDEPQESCEDEQLLRPTSSIRPDAAVTTLRTTYSGASAVVAPEYLPLDTLEPPRRSRTPSPASSPCLPPSVSTYALPIAWRPPALAPGARRPAAPCSPQRSC